MKPNKHPYRGDSYNKHTMMVFWAFIVLASLLTFVAWYLE
jgi:hypothetical protein